MYKKKVELPRQKKGTAKKGRVKIYFSINI
jgi:hypothetical protein